MWKEANKVSGNVKRSILPSPLKVRNVINKPSIDTIPFIFFSMKVPIQLADLIEISIVLTKLTSEETSYRLMPRVPTLWMQLQLS